MSAQTLIIIGCLIIGMLGVIHFIYVLATNKFNAYDDKVTQAMKNTSPNLTKQTTMWRALVGFNYSHSFGILWIVMIYIPLALNHMPILQQSVWLSLLLPLTALVYAILAKKYWFNIPFVGSLITLFCFSWAFYLMHMA